MINFLSLFWKAISVPLSWMPPICLTFLKTLGTAVVVVLMLLVVKKFISMVTPL